MKYIVLVIAFSVPALACGADYTITLGDGTTVTGSGKTPAEAKAAAQQARNLYILERDRGKTAPSPDLRPFLETRAAAERMAERNDRADAQLRWEEYLAWRAKQPYWKAKLRFHDRTTVSADAWWIYQTYQWWWTIDWVWVVPPQ